MSTSSTRSVVIAAILIFLTGGQSAGAPCGLNVEFPRVTDEQIFSQFEGAILRIQSKTVQSTTKVGSGFLIDAKQGFVLTAGHVVSDVTSIIARSPALPRQELKLLLVKDLTQSSQIDVALLQLDPPDALSEVIPIDIAFRVPQTGATAYAMGYSREENDPSKQSVTVTKITEQDGIVVKASSYPGDSGSPLISDRGIAIGITRARIDAAIARYTPMSDALELLSVIPITTNMGSIDERVRLKRIAQEDLKSELKRGRTTTSLRNVDLVSWASHIVGSRARYADVRGLFDCPIVPAFWNRTLDEAASLLTSIMTAALKSQTRLRIAQNAAALGRNSLAEREIASALADDSEAISYSEEIGLDSKFARALSGKAAVKRGNYDRAIAEYDQAIQIDPLYVFARINRGDAYFEKKEYDRALMDYKETIRINPNHASALQKLALIEQAKGAVQQQPIPVIGFIRTTSAEDSAKLVEAFRSGLREIGFIEGRNVAIEYRYAGGGKWTVFQHSPLIWLLGRSRCWPRPAVRSPRALPRQRRRRCRLSSRLAMIR